jgi:hypothetical protein
VNHCDGTYKKIIAGNFGGYVIAQRYPSPRPWQQGKQMRRIVPPAQSRAALSKCGIMSNAIFAELIMATYYFWRS